MVFSAITFIPLSGTYRQERWELGNTKYNLMSNLISAFFNEN